MGDLLTSFNGKSISYDTIGNPTTIGGSILTWQGRELTYFENADCQSVYFNYNADGIRTCKTFNDAMNMYGHSIEYMLNGSQIIGEHYTYNDCEENYREYTVIYIYDETGSPIGLKYREPSYAEGVYNYYFFEKNLQGDIVAIFNNSGFKMGAYNYDAWGNFTIDSAAMGLEREIVYEINPFRYRGYYYDVETGWYYLQSRYYNPEWGRFLNADNNLSNNNLFMYCENNSVNKIDPYGEHWYYLWLDDLLEAVDQFCASVSNFVYGRAAYAQSFNDPSGAYDLWNSRPFQEATPSQEMQIFTEFMLEHDFVSDVSISIDVNKDNVYFKVGGSKVLSPSKNIDASYVHAGIGQSTTSILPINITYSVGIVKGVNIKEDYAKSFISVGGGAIFGFDYCFWPNGSSAYSFTIGTSYGVYAGYDYYWCLD